MRDYNFYVYILTNINDKVMYIGVTNDLKRRITEHRLHIIPGFTQRYNVYKLVYFEHFTDIRDAIGREKELKGWTRARKNALVEERNPEWAEIKLV